MRKRHGDQRKLLSAMAFLHCEIMGRQESVSFKSKDDHDITFIYDTDIIATYLEPWKTGPLDNEGGWGYGQLLPRMHRDEDKLQYRASEDSIAWFTASLLARKALKAPVEYEDGSSSDENAEDQSFSRALSCIYQFPHHYSETNSHLKYLDRETKSIANRDPETNEERRFKVLTEVLVVSAIERGQSDQQIVDLISKRFESRFMRFGSKQSKLLREKENYTKFLNRYGDIHKFDFDAFNDLLNDAKEKVDLNFEYFEVEKYARRALELFWQDRLGSKSGDSLKADARALTDMAIYNKRLLMQGVKRRLVFVTGDRTLVRATYNTKPEYLEPIIRRVLMADVFAHKLNVNDNHEAAQLLEKLYEFFGIITDESDEYSSWFSRFSFHYIRHFWAIAPDALLENAKTIQLKDLFHGLFATEGERLSLSRQNMERLVLNGTFGARGAELNHEGFIDLSDWYQFTKERIETARAEEFGLNDIDVRAIRNQLKAEGGESFYTRLSDVFEEYLSRQRDRTMLSFSNRGATELVRSAENASRPPDLFFQTLTNTNKIFTNLSIRDYYKNTEHSFMDDFLAIKDDCCDKNVRGELDDRQKSHLKFLVLAAVFAAAEKWEAAYGHARRAINIIERSDEPIPVRSEIKSNMSGREAYYIASVCRRMLAITEQDLIKYAKQHLDSARKALVKDMKANEDLIQEKHNLRFNNETLSQYIATYYFVRSQVNGDVESVYKPRKGQVYDCVSEYAPAFITFLQEMLAEDRDETFKLTCDIVSCNILQSKVIAHFWQDNIFIPGDMDHFRELYELALQWLNKRKEEENYIETFIIGCYRRVCNGLQQIEYSTSETTVDVFDTPEDVEAFFDIDWDKGTYQNKQLSRYEFWRLEALKDFALVNLFNG
ncbi:hypothetical protein V5T82_16955 [Magnetovibrio sp. PR-2]|uniref:hypothetical protein n=1 Tax=Magnetovibrio sp. PR-2 TaxID=3120356 RepID=UPI002FCE5E2B